MTLPLKISRKLALFLAALGFSMAGVALSVDLHDFVETPWYLWLWVPICSLYPFLLGVNYLFFVWRGEFPRFLLIFTLVGIFGYGMVAPVFYGLYLFEHGFGWYEFGNIFWVWLYAAQGFLLLPYVRRVSCLPWWQFFLVAGYFFVKDFLDRFSVTWSYVRYEMLSQWHMNLVFVALVLVHGLLLVWLMRLALPKASVSSKH